MRDRKLYEIIHELHYRAISISKTEPEVAKGMRVVLGCIENEVNKIAADREEAKIYGGKFRSIKKAAEAEIRQQGK